MFVKEKPKKSWIDTNGLDGKILKNIILNSDCLITDLDGTIADPAKQIAIYDNIFNGRILNPFFIYWAGKTGIKQIITGKEAESDSWKEYIKLFLRNVDELHKIEEQFSNGKVESLLYLGVKEFYRLLPRNMLKILMTRNILEIGDAFAVELNISIVADEVFKKGREIELIIKQNPNFKRYVVFDDYEQDFEIVLDVLEFYKNRADKSKRIESYSGIFVSDSENKLNRNAIANIGRNYTNLVDIVKVVQ